MPKQDASYTHFKALAFFGGGGTGNEKGSETIVATGDIVFGYNFATGSTLLERNLLFIDPGGASRLVDLPAEADSDGKFHVIANTADAVEDLTVRDDAAATIVVISQDQVGFVFCNGVVWKGGIMPET